MTRKIVFALMIVSLLLLASCGGGGTNRGFGSGSKNTNNDESFLLGTRGLDIKLADPETLVVPAGQSVRFDIIIENMGNNPLAVINYFFSGYDTRYLNYPNNANEIRDLKGKSRYGPGDQIYIPVASSSPVSLDNSEIRRLEQPTTINFCYSEKTRIAIPLCIDLDPLRDGPCPTEGSKSLSEGQGAPVGISSLNYKSYRKDENNIRFNFDMTFEQFDTSAGAKVFNIDSNPCNFATRPEIQKEDDVKLIYKTAELDVICPGLDKIDVSNGFGFFDLERRPTIRCYADIPSNLGESVNSVLNMGLEYTMWQKVTQPIVIEKY